VSGSVARLGFFYVAAAVISEVVAMSIGSSWTTAGTISGAWAATITHLPFALFNLRTADVSRRHIRQVRVVKAAPRIDRRHIWQVPMAIPPPTESEVID
jgi:hypothetical protein